MYSVHWRKPSTNAFHAFHLCTMQHQTCEQEHTADPHVLFQHLGVDFYRRTSDKACTLGQFCWPVVQWSCQANGLLQNLPRRLSGVHQRVRLRWEDWEKNCRILDLKHSSLEQWWFSVGANVFLYWPHTVDCAFEGLPCALCLEAVLDHPMRPGFANFWRSSFHSQSHCPDELSWGSRLSAQFELLAGCCACGIKLESQFRRTCYIFLLEWLWQIEGMMRKPCLYLHTRRDIGYRSFTSSNESDVWFFGVILVSFQWYAQLKVLRDRSFVNIQSSDLAASWVPFGEIASRPHRCWSAFTICISWSPSICQAFIPQVIGDIIYLKQSLCAPCDLRVLTAAEAQWWLLLQSSISAEYLVANSVLLVMNSRFISGDDGRCFFWQHCTMRSMSLRQSPAVARFFFDEDKLQDFSSIQWWHVVSHKPHASKPWRLGNPESTTCQVRHCTSQSTALVLQLHKVAAGRDSKLALRSCMLKPKLILSNRSHVIQHN